MMEPALTTFHPLIQTWFSEKFAAATEVQKRAWPLIANKEHLLITAPTGSGKTLTAFLWAINQFLTGQYQTGASRVLYVSPLKALNNDIERNLRKPLAALQALADAQSIDFPKIRVQTRSGDSEAGERRRMLRHPPEILITTPESLNLMLSSQSGQAVLTTFETVILDEVHAVMDNKRGAYLMAGIERLVALGGEFQRIALSATINPLPLVAEYVAGFERIALDEFKPRKIQILASEAEKQYAVKIRYPKEAAERPAGDKVWDSLAKEWVEIIRANKSTLFFVNSRALCEKLTYKINQAAGETLAWAHHGSLAREIRFAVETKLKQGELPAIVATSTLEMGIDIGSLDEVILIQCPPGIANTIQRIGRAGHGVGEVSRSTIYPTHPTDFIEAAVLSRAIINKDIEPIATIENPLDVLAQVIISMAAFTTLDVDELFLEVKRATTFQSLSRRQFDLVLQMLIGRYEESHLHALKPKVVFDETKNTIRSLKGSVLSLYMSGGVIPDRGYFQLRHSESNARIGELDEEFVWEAHVGKIFSFGTQYWQIKSITHSDVTVLPAKPTGLAPPFWKSEGISRSFHYAEKINDFLEYAEAQFDSLEATSEKKKYRELQANFGLELQNEYQFDEVLTDTLLELLDQQRSHSHAPLPHRHHLLFETTQTSPGGAKGQQLILHTGWGSKVNRPLAMALEAAWQNKWHEQIEVFVTDQSLLLQLSHKMSFADLMDLINQDDIEQLLRQRLEGSGFFGARFRENAGRALLLSKGRFNERKPLWMSRLQSQKLLDAVLKFDDFPILLETWRSCLKDEFDLDNLKLMLSEINTGLITVSEVSTNTPSPFARSQSYDQINTYMYMDDQLKTNKSSQLNLDLIQEIINGDLERPKIPHEILAAFLSKKQRLDINYCPSDATDLIEWVKERSFIPLDEWRVLVEMVNSKHSDKAVIEWKDLSGTLIEVAYQGAIWITAIQDKDKFCTQLASPNKPYLSNWLQYYGPISSEEIRVKTGLSHAQLQPYLSQGLDNNSLVYGQLMSDDTTQYWCDISSFEILLRFLRQSKRLEFEAKPASELTPFLFNWQDSQLSNDSDVLDVIETLRLYPASPALWESEFLPSRSIQYQTNDLDIALGEENLIWFGANKQQISFSFAEDLDLLVAEHTDSELFRDTAARYEFGQLLDNSGLNSEALTEQLWQGVFSGSLSNDSMKTLRQGINHKFKAANITDINPSHLRRSRRGGMRQFAARTPFSGTWFQINYPTEQNDVLANESLRKDRVRVLLERYGLLFRELLLKELPEFQWRSLFRSLRLMELSGELYSGHFFEDIQGLQFISPAALKLLQQDAANDKVFWVNAQDPVSCCGLALSSLRSSLPKRLASNHMVYHGNKLVMVSERNGAALKIMADSEAKDLSLYFEFFNHLLERSFQPIKRIVIETINTEPAKSSKYLAALKQQFDVIVDHKSVYLQRSQ